MRIRADILTPRGISTDSVVEIDDSGKIVSVGAASSQAADYNYPSGLIVPGFIDLHVHGAGGSDFMDGSISAVRTVARTHARYGTTSLLATTLTAGHEAIDRAISAVVSVIEQPGPNEAKICGIHLEGPYICRSRRGAQPEAPIRPPDIAEIDHWQKLSGGRIKQITLAPEIDGAVEFIAHAAALGINVSLGHTNADSESVVRAVDAGARMGTHLFNAMTGLGHRAPGAVGALLTEDRVTCELICDGFHVAPMTVKLAVRAKGAAKIVLITDAMSGAAMVDGTYKLGGSPVIVRNGTAKFADGTLAGSILTMNTAFANIRKFSGATVAEAATMSSSNAARLLGLDDEMGAIEPGKSADLAVLDRNTGDVLATIQSGKFVYQSK
jgi:N-acetylglucosamine-6-phosphate deacetylase